MSKDTKEIPFAIKRMQQEQARICQEIMSLEKKLDGCDIFLSIKCSDGMVLGYARLREEKPCWGIYVDRGSGPVPALMAPADMKIVAAAHLQLLTDNIEQAADVILSRKVEQPSVVLIEK